MFTTAVSQQMDNVALSCFFLAMASVAVNYCRDGLCRSRLWARCILTAIRLLLSHPDLIHHEYAQVEVNRDMSVTLGMVMTNECIMVLKFTVKKKFKINF